MYTMMFGRVAVLFVAMERQDEEKPRDSSTRARKGTDKIAEDRQSQSSQAIGVKELSALA
jgi:hypothetical protein